MSRVEDLKLAMEMIMDIENNKKNTISDKAYWTGRILLGSIASSLAVIADNTSKRGEAEGCKMPRAAVPGKSEENRKCVDCAYYYWADSTNWCGQCQDYSNWIEKSGAAEPEED